MTCDCGHEPSPHEAHTTGYGTWADGKTACWECCADADRSYMQRHGRITLYLTTKPIPPFGGIYGDCEITNWPGTLRFAGRYTTGRHNIARTRYDAWFRDSEGSRWHGVTYGDYTQLCHCRKLKGA